MSEPDLWEQLQAPTLAELILGLQVLLLLVLHRAICRIHALLVAAGRGGAPAAGGAADTCRLPSVASLAPEKIRDNWQPRADWSPLTTEELRVAAKLREWLGGAEFDALPRDILVQFVRGYSYRDDWHDATGAYLGACLAWRKGHAADSVLLAPPPAGHELFEECLRSGVIGEDREGRPVVIDCIGRIPAAKLVANFDEAAYMRHQIYNREALRLYSSANSRKRGKRIYKAVGVLDLAGLSLAHSDPKILSLLRAQNSAFGYNYPESVQGMIIVNTPWVFRSIWAIVKGWLHPVTAAKVRILGSDYHGALAEMGITLHSPKGIADRIEPWSHIAQRLMREGDRAELLRGYMPAEDEEQLARLARR